MELLFISGMSGAGKSSAMDILEDLNYYCVDNMPLKLIPTFLELINDASHEKVAIATDIRAVDLFSDLDEVLSYLKEKDVDYKVIFLDCDENEILKRYKLSRRRHPLMENADKKIITAVRREKELLFLIREKADFVIDTTFLSAPKLKERIMSVLKDEKEGMRIYCMSFGFKFGIPAEADLMFDVRCLPNPYYVESLKQKTGFDKEVREYVMNSESSRVLLEKFKDLVDYLIPLYEAEGKSQLVIAFGCSGGHHRSVTFALRLGEYLKEEGYMPIVSHRDLEKK